MPYVWKDERSGDGVYRFNYVDASGHKRTGTGTTSKSETQDFARHVQAMEKAKRKEWIQESPKWKKETTRLFKQTFEEYLAWGESQGGRGGRPWSKEHARVRKLWLEWWEKNLSLQTLGDLQNILSRAEVALRGLLDKGTAGKTVQNCAESLRAFGRWAKKREFLGEDPLAGLAKFDSTPKTCRRALTIDELQRLFEKCLPHRRLLYEVACTTGLRRGELRALTVKHLDVKNKGLMLEASWTKNRQATFHPLPAEIVSRLEKTANEKLAEKEYERIAEERKQRGAPNKVKPPANPLLYVPDDTARELDSDLKRANIRKGEKHDKIDFHALRVCYVTCVLEAGANVKEAQTLARHATPNLTMNVYARARSERLAEVTERVAKVMLQKPKDEAKEKVPDAVDTTSDKQNCIPLAYKPPVVAEAVSVNADDKYELDDSKMAERVGFEPT